ncbi:MAG: lipopolysaccharide assembly LapA domain-containing protein [Limosilactobacillus sp.]
MKKQSTMIVSIILLIIFVIFALLNTTAVEVNLLFGKVKMPLVLLILVCMLIGALIIYLFSFSNHLKVSKELKALQNQPGKATVDKLKQDVKQLQTENQRLKKALDSAQSAKQTQPTQPTHSTTKD